MSRIRITDQSQLMVFENQKLINNQVDPAVASPVTERGHKITPLAAPPPAATAEQEEDYENITSSRTRPCRYYNMYFHFQRSLN